MSSLPVLIVGAGVSGLILAQHLRANSVPFLVFERDSDLATRGLGWGLTLHWSLPALRHLLPAHIYDRLPEAYVDREAVERGEASRFPFYDLSTGELRAATPKAPEGQRVRVTRARLRKLVAEGIDIQWNKAFSSYTSTPSSVTVTFEDGSSYTGCLLVGCDGGTSRVRRALFPAQYERHRVPVRTMGFRADFSPQEIADIRAMDSFFLQAAASENDTFLYFSVLSGPQHAPNKKPTNKYTCQLVVSWPDRPGFFGEPSGIEYPETDQGRLELLHRFASTWAEPFRSLVLGVELRGTGSHKTARSGGGVTSEIKTLDLFDWPPPKGLRGEGRVVLMGDSMHQMTMYRGEGANHAIVDVQDFADLVSPVLSRTSISPADGTPGPSGFEDLRSALDAYEDAVVDRARPGVLASRRACLDAHEWKRIDETSPLLSRRAMKLDFDEE
ncbi:hypothetical protein SAPIO_CDS8006 [Scedosporium apiospermum]|uniref:FAD-binding domain-containing protein n=1 Tax=Pseudallescheria apiosperma TaxID=563466 RepID=A0A084G0F3_PSEDA|nr:uncharacterized protein SAPIO_CDS8006 [Scedosporium apiospermum]KEZ40815.1 hypothetical protein SAPIO_CDS8006 [Scedosporium apiospermum]